MSRADTILSRFPAHFEADKPGKLIGAVAAGLARDLDVQAAQLSGIRRAHRLYEAWSEGDLMRLGALHGIRAGEVDLLRLRLEQVGALADALEAADADGQGAAVDALLALFSLELPEDPLTAFAPPEPAPGAAVQALVDAARRVAAAPSHRAALARRIHAIAATHLAGNGTVLAVLRATANALDLEIARVEHSDDRYWHAAEVFDRLRPLPDPLSGLAAPTVRSDVIGVEENPLRRGEQPPEERHHGECFELLRKGFDPAPLEINVIAEGARSVGPMIVNRDQGRGVGFTGAVPPGETLTFTENGRVLLDGADVTSLAFGFDGAVFADAAGAGDDTGRDATFDNATFVTTTPPGALDREADFPHAGPSLAMPEIGIGSTRMAVFMQEAHFARATAGGGGQLADADFGVFAPDAPVIPTPRSNAGYFTGAPASSVATFGSVFAGGDTDTPEASALVSFAWAEHAAYRARVLIPARFALLSAQDAGRSVTARVAQALERVRPLGVSLEVAFVDTQWTLGESILPVPESGAPPDLISRLGGSTLLWPGPDDDFSDPDDLPVDPEDS